MTATEQVLHWLCRDYTTCEYWLSVADVFFVATIEQPTGDSDSELARTRLAKHLETIFQTFQPCTLAVRRWRKDCVEQETAEILPPETLDGVDWEFIADYFLMHISADSDVLLRQNEGRVRVQNAKDSRLQANIKRAENHFNSTVDFLATNNVTLPTKKTGSGTVDIRKRMRLIEEEEKNDNCQFKEISPYRWIGK